MFLLGLLVAPLLWGLFAALPPIEFQSGGGGVVAARRWGAIGVAIGPLTWARHQSRSLLGKPMQLPTKRELDPRLIGGSLLFGIGWGIAGICPGPAVAILLTGRWQAIVFMLAMLAGMLLFTALETRRNH
nr:DUF6691 family protein [Pseudomonas sp. K2]